jgi:hypothetical protein
MPKKNSGMYPQLAIDEHGFPAKPKRAANENALQATRERPVDAGVEASSLRIGRARTKKAAVPTRARRVPAGGERGFESAGRDPLRDEAAARS